ncbi:MULTISPECIES: DUF3606 domain-containing protein [Rhizobium]|uniref:DUF3606 domain-containing protein n=1 Tax=Rhizobium TaxID=379 RepID=UPI001B3216B1|nr:MULTISPECIES: DUF3606 domain-containing protein [Rhizobium]MBX4911249.1 DUF3606 domain-containing protein [Rhizobium bangladeshense]MBX5260365.1 DUF3606 domain-containing protein [Rhizobium sp. NLR16b]MBX5266455.1 DUF3606 domain-containing protein [Rhizobium sp. NLR16a]MBX5315023.1 DUF3606 domain-containing protein [Rhizobium sp. NLR11b]QTU98122.1 DUF3606 domain-containing protein [Rhizobium sp. NLR16a]
MADNKKALKQDRKRVSAEQPYELSYFRRKHGLTVDQAKDIIKKAGNNRDKANELAEQHKK